MNNQQKTVNNQHAVVIGASMAGLLAARVLSDRFEQVTIIERDRLSDQVEPRKGVPQGRHVHILLAKGESILREYFPDFYTTFAQDGAIPLTTSDIRWFDSGLWKAAAPEPIKSHSAGRPFLETYVRRFLAERANVRFIGREIASHLPENVKPFMFGSYPSSLFLSDIPVQGVVAGLKQAQRQPQTER